MYNILICDDEKDIVSSVEIFLIAEGYKVFVAHNGSEAVEMVRSGDIQLVLMDVMMPVMDGIEATAKIREFSNIPVIMITAKSEDADTVLGLNVGADDYITKPFNLIEVAARVRSHLRRYLTLGGVAPAQQSPDCITIGGIMLNDAEKTVTLDGEPVNLTPIEYNILRFLMQNPGTVFSSGTIYEKVWQSQTLGADNIVAVHIRHLREKIEIDPAEPRYLKVVWGQGYKFEKNR